MKKSPKRGARAATGRKANAKVDAAAATVLACVYGMLAELSPASRRKLLELPEADLRKLADTWASECRTLGRAA